MVTIRCLHALSEWEGLSVLSEGTWAQADKSIKKKIAPLASAAAWNLRDWDTMPDYVAAIPDDTVIAPLTFHIAQLTSLFTKSWKVRSSGQLCTYTQQIMMQRKTILNKREFFSMVIFEVS